jgi:tyrosine-protein phosphatase non-receptor type 11
MVWQEKCRVIVMTTNEVERGRNKCTRYWANKDEQKEVGPFTIACLSEADKHSHIIRELLVLKDGESESRTMFQFHFKAWPDHGVPNDPGDVLHFLDDVRKRQDGMEDAGPVLVHCSAGIGRTGTFMAIELGMQQYLKEGVVDPLQYMCSMRQDRGGSIQTADQYLFIHKALADFIARVAK